MKKTITNNKTKITDSHQIKREELLSARKKQLDNEKQHQKTKFNWLTQHSRDFLAAGYLTKDISPEKRIRKIII